MDPRRTERLIESLRGELEEILNYELDDPRMTPVGITEVLLAPDARRGRVRIRVEGAPDQQQACLEAIEKANGYIRHLLQERIPVFRLPDLAFEADLPPELKKKAEGVLRRIRRGRPRPQLEKNPSE